MGVESIVVRGSELVRARVEFGFGAKSVAKSAESDVLVRAHSARARPGSNLRPVEIKI